MAQGAYRDESYRRYDRPRRDRDRDRDHDRERDPFGFAIRRELPQK